MTKVHRIGAKCGYLVVDMQVIYLGNFGNASRPITALIFLFNLVYAIISRNRNEKSNN